MEAAKEIMKANQDIKKRLGHLATLMDRLEDPVKTELQKWKEKNPDSKVIWASPDEKAWCDLKDKEYWMCTAYEDEECVTYYNLSENPEEVIDQVQEHIQGKDWYHIKSTDIQECFRVAKAHGMSQHVVPPVELFDLPVTPSPKRPMASRKTAQVSCTMDHSDKEYLKNLAIRLSRQKGTLVTISGAVQYLVAIAKTTEEVQLEKQGANPVRGERGDLEA
jgi:hypothetical protein